MDEIRMLSNSPCSVWSGSITPPLEDLNDDFDDVDMVYEESQCIVNITDRNHASVHIPGNELIFLCCIEKNNGNDLLQNGFLKSGVFKRILDGGELCNSYGIGSRNLFGVPAIQSNYSKLLQLMRKKFLTIERSRKADNSLSALKADLNNYKDFINDLKHLLIYFRIWIQSSPRIDTVSVINDVNFLSCNSLLDEYNRLLKFFRSLFRRAWFGLRYMDDFWSSLPNDTCFHIYLNIVINYQLLLSTCLQKETCGVDNGYLVPRLKECLVNFLEDVASITMNRFRKAWDITTRLDSKALPCPCVKEGLILMIYITEKFSQLESFWVMVWDMVNQLVHPNIDTYNETESTLCKGTECEDLVGFTWWFVKDISSLYWFDECGIDQHASKKFVTGNWLLVQDLLKVQLDDNSQRDVFGKAGKESLTYCLNFLKHWVPSTDVVMQLWDFVQRKLNGHFLPSDATLQDRLIPRYSPWQWINKCRRYSTMNGMESDTFFDLFLRNLAHFFRKSLSPETGQSWDQIKGRFYSKFHKKRMQELGEIGLYNFITLFLTLVCVTDSDDAAKKMSYFLSMVIDNSAAKKLMLVKAHFSLVHILRENKKDTSFISSKLLDRFLELCRQFKSAPYKAHERYDHWQIAILFMDSVEELLDTGESLGQEMCLIQCDEAYSLLVHSSKASELQRIIQFVQALLSSQLLQDTSGKHFKDLSLILMDKFYPMFQVTIDRRMKDENLFRPLADLAASFTALAWKCFAAKHVISVKFEEMLKIYLREVVDSKFVGRYVCQVLSPSELYEGIIACELQGQFINVWFKTSLSLTFASETTLDITRACQSLPEVSKFSNKESITNAEAGERFLLSFIEAQGNFLESLTLFQDIINFKKKVNVYLDGLSKCLEAALQPGTAQTRVRLAYMVCGKVLKCLSKAIYSKTVPDCLLPKLLDTMILPLILSSKPQDPNITRNIVNQLHQVLLGLATLDFRRDDFVKRKIKELFTRYFLVTTERQRAGKTQGNPFLIAFKPSCVPRPSKDASDFRQFLLQLIVSNFLTMPQSPATLSTTLYFVHVLFEKTQSGKVIIRNAPLVVKQVLGYLLACDVCQVNQDEEPPGIRSKAMAILRLISQARADSESDYGNELTEYFKEFLTSNIKEFEVSIFKTFAAVAVLFPHIMSEIHAAIHDYIASEERQGNFVSEALRTACETLVKAAPKS